MMQKDFLYEAIANKITKLIRDAVIKPGDKVPSVRRFSAQQRVSVSTVLQAYLLLEDRGILEARPQSGFYVRFRAAGLPPEPSGSFLRSTAATVDIDEQVARVFEATQQSNIVQLGVAIPHTDLLPNNRLKTVTNLILRESPALVNSYEHTVGNAELRRQIARRSLDMGCSFSSDEIIVTAGCSEALFLCLRAVARPGDIIAVETPTYYGVLRTIQSLDMKALEIPTHPRKGISLGHLRAELKKHAIKACVVMPNFHNPLGFSMPDRQKEELVALLNHHDIPLIEDDVYAELHFDAERPKPAKAFDKKDLVLLCSSFSKTISPGARVGWAVPGRYRKQVEKLKRMTNNSTATLPQIVISRYLQNGGYDHFLRKIRKAYALQMEQMLGAVTRYFPEGTRVTRPDGGCVLWVEMPRRVSGLELHRRALKNNIAVAPGMFFSAKRRYHNCIRINCANPWSEKIEQAVATLGRLARSEN